MGNRQLSPQIFNESDADLQCYRKLYQRYSINKSKPQLNCINVQNLLEYQIIMHNEIFSEVVETHHHVNLKNKTVNVELNLHRFCNLKEYILLNLSIWLNDKLLPAQFIRIEDILKSPRSRTIIDISDPSVLFPIVIKPEDKLKISYRYLMTHKVCQNSIFIFKIPLSLECPFQIDMQILPKLDVMSSPSHKMDINGQHLQIKYQRGVDLPLFLLMFTLPSQEQARLYIHKTLCGADGYAEEQKYCLLTTAIPAAPQQFEEMVYFNFDDPQLVVESVETLDTMQLGTLTIRGLSFDDHVHSILEGVKRHITFFMDQSNSMYGTKMTMAKSALQIFVKSLPVDTFINIYSFGTKYTKMFPKHQLISEQAMQVFQSKILQLEGNMGSTFLFNALQDAINYNCESYQCVWFILTDGRIAESTEILNFLQQHPHIRVYSLGIGVEFDQYFVEQLAMCGNGNYAFCQNLYSLNTQVIELLQEALAPVMRPTQVKMNDAHITSIYPNPTTYQHRQNTPMAFYTFMDSSALNTQITVSMSIQIEGQQPYDIQGTCNPKDASRSNVLHIYAFAQHLDALLKLLPGNQTAMPELLTQYNYQFYDFVKSSTRYQFFNPLLGIDLGQFILVQHINVTRLHKMQQDTQQEQDILTQILKVFPSNQPDLRQILAQMPQQGDNSLQLESVSLELGSSFTLASQDYLIKLIYLQQMDGSFLEEKTMHMICPVRNPLENLLAKMPEVGPSRLVQGRQSQQLPRFMLTQVWVTALAIAYLKLNYRVQRGQWLLIYIRSINFLKQYTKNWQALLAKARRDLIQAQFD